MAIVSSLRNGHVLLDPVLYLSHFSIGDHTGRQVCLPEEGTGALRQTVRHAPPFLCHLSGCTLSQCRDCCFPAFA